MHDRLTKFSQTFQVFELSTQLVFGVLSLEIEMDERFRLAQMGKKLQGNWRDNGSDMIPKWPIPFKDLSSFFLVGKLACYFSSQILGEIF